MLSFLFIILLVSNVSANTEIISFNARKLIEARASESNDLQQLLEESNVTSLSSTQSERTFNVLPAPIGTPSDEVCADVRPGYCENEVWLKMSMDSEGWRKFDMFTLRVSWPAYVRGSFSSYLTKTLIFDVYHQHRTDFSMNVFEGSDLQKYARIRLVDTGVRVPNLSVESVIAPSSSQSRGPVPFNVVLEPLLAGVTPRSVVPIASFVALSFIPVGLFLPRILRELSNVANEAGKELRDPRFSKRD
jgi:hypothetical protein